MKSINFNDGIREYMINGDESRIIRIRLDPGMAERFEEAAADIDGMIQNCGGRSKAEIISGMGAELCRMINKAFGTDVCTAAFGGVNPLTPVSDGKPLYQAFFEALMPEIEADIKALTTARKTDVPQLRPEAEKYILPDLSPQYKGDSKIPDISGLSKEEKADLIAQLIS